MKSSKIIILIFAISLIGFVQSSQASQIFFSGPLGYVQIDSGNAIYSGDGIGTVFYGVIDDGTYSGSISDGITTISFNDLIYAGGLEVLNNVLLENDEVDVLTHLGFTGYDENTGIDIINLEGDSFVTSTGGRIEIGLSFLFSPETFINNSDNNYPFNENDVQLALFFISEFDAQEECIYSAFGNIDTFITTPVPNPSTAILLGLGAIVTLVFNRKIRTNHYRN